MKQAKRAIRKTERVAPAKVAQVAQIKDRFARAKSVVLSDFRGLTVRELTDLRRELRREQMELKVYKNRLVKQALGDSGAGLDPFLTGPTLLAFSYHDPVAPARLLAKFTKDHRALGLKAGLIEGQVLDKSAVGELAKLPGRPELLTQLVHVLNSPITGLVRVLAGPMRNLVTVLSQIKDKKQA